MTDAQFCINWNSYVNHVSKGFSSLQQNAEFVDMTLAAEGHLVKVHQNIVALASPYLKAMLQSASCQHPVIFLNNISHEILGYILEYIYTGEVKIPTNVVNTFVTSCKSLCINGIKDIEEKNIPGKQSDIPNKRLDNLQEITAAHITINTNNEDYNIECAPNQSNENSSNNQKETITPDVYNVANNDQDMEIDNHISPSIEHNQDSLNDLDISSIQDYVIWKPKTISPDETKVKENPIKIISDITINPLKDWQTEVSSSHQQHTTNDHPLNITQNNTSIENPLNIMLDTSNWFSAVNQNTLNIETNHPPIVPETLNTGQCLTMPIENRSNIDLNTNPISITINTDDWQVGSSQNGTEVQETEPTAEIIINSKIDKTLDKTQVFRNIKKIGSFMKAAKNQEKRIVKTISTIGTKLILDNTPRYTVSNRGALQLILNHFMYNLHHNSSGGRKKRWRCINYRKMQCPAFVDTVDDAITEVSAEHDHPNHDNVIRKKVKSNLVFSSLSIAVSTIKNVVEDN